MNVICLIGDIVGSRTASDRPALQRRLKQALERANRGSASHLLSPGTITLGDEYQAVYKDAGALFVDLWSVLRQMHPQRIRFSIGIGALDTPLNRKQAIGMDGPAFHIARKNMEGPLKRSGLVFHVARAEGSTPGWINTSLALMSSQIGSWKPVRHLIFERHLQRTDVKRIAVEAHITTTAVYKNIRSGGLDAMRDLVGEIAAWMDEQVP